MARVNFQVTAVNDLSGDGADNKRVVLTSDRGKLIQTGAVPGLDFPAGSYVNGSFDLVVDNATQAKYFPIGSLHGFDFIEASEPATAPKTKKKAKAKKAKKKK